jgi:hypothetical protein
MCSIVQAAALALSTTPQSPLFPNTPRAVQPEVLWRDDNFTAYLEKSNPVSSKGHIVIVFKQVLDPHPIHELFLTFAPAACMFLLYILWYDIQPSRLLSKLTGPHISLPAIFPF